MSTIDERVVEMRFDNEQFQKGIEDSIESLDNLKESLELDEATKSLEKLEKAGSDFSLDGVTKAVDEVQNKFNALEAVAFGAFASIGAQAASTGLKIAKSFSVDQIFAGKGKYELKTQSVQAIKAALPDTDLSEIMEQLEDLNKYTDETSYDFSQMVATIGKFTANGIKLKESVEAMKGIGNEAAKSGANIGEANRAMYNFAQALSSGSVKYVDWKSIELANMGTKEFKQTIIDTAVELGVLKKAGDKIKTKKGTLVDFTNFATTLNEGWFTSDVLVKTLNKYADVTTDFGLDAFHAAQQALTFTQAMQAIADAASTGWARTFELLFGDLDEAIDFFTGFCNQVIEVINAFDESRNNLIKAWRGQDILDENGEIAEEIDNEIDGRTKLLEGLNDALWGLYAIAESVKAAFVDIFPSSINDKANTLIELTTQFADAMRSFRQTLVNDTVLNDLSDDDALLLSNLIGMSKNTHKANGTLSEKENKRVIREATSLVQILQKMGYLGEDASKIAIDVAKNGFTDELSEKLKLLQKDLGLTETGVYDLNTAILLTEKYIRDRNADEAILPFLDLKKNGKTLDEVKQLQQALTDLGYELGSADGIFGKKTEKAVKNFQKDMGLAETGIVDVTTAMALYKKMNKKEDKEPEFEYYGRTKTFNNLKRIFKPIAAGVKVILTGLKAIVKSAAGVGASILKAVSPVLDVLAVIGDGLTAALSWFSDSGVLDFIADWLISSTSFAADLVRYGAEALKFIFGFGEAVESEDGKIHNFAQLIGYIVEKVKSFDIFGKISEHLQTFKDRISISNTKLGEWFETFKTNMDEKWQERFDSIVSGIDEFFSVFSGDNANSAAESGERTTTWVTSFANAILTISNVVDSKCRKAADILSEFFIAFNGDSDRLQYRTGDEPWWVKLGEKAKALSEWINSTSTKIGAKWSLFLYALRGDTRASEKSPWYVKLGTQIRKIFDWIGDKVDTIKPKWEGFLSAFKGEAEVTEDSPWWVKLGEKVQTLWTWIEEKVEAVKTAWTDFLSTFKGDAEVSEDGPWWAKLGEKVQTLWTWIEEKVEAVKTAWTDFLSSFKGDTEISEDSPWWVKLGEKVQTLWTWIEEKVDAVKTAWTDFLSTFSSSDGKPEDYQPWWVTVGYAFQDAWGWILEKVTAVKDAITEIKKSIFGEIGGEVETAEYYKALEKNKMYDESGNFVGARDPKTGNILTPEEYKEKMFPYFTEQYNNEFGQLSFITTSYEMLSSTIEDSTKGQEKKPWWWTIIETLVKFSSSIGAALGNVQTAWQGFLSAFKGNTVAKEDDPWYIKLGSKVQKLWKWIKKEADIIRIKWLMFISAFKGERTVNDKSPWYVKLGDGLGRFFDTLDERWAKIKPIWDSIVNAFNGDDISEESPWYLKLASKLGKAWSDIKRIFADMFSVLFGKDNAEEASIRLQEKFGWVLKIVDGIRNVFTSIGKIMGNSLGKIFPFLKKFNAETTGFIGVFTAILGGFAIGKATSIVNDVANFLQLFKGNVLNTVTNMKFQFRPFSLMFLEMSAAILLIAASIKLIADIDIAQLAKASAVVVLLFVLMAKIAENVLKLSAGGSSVYEKTLRSYARMMLEFAIAMGAVTAMIYILGKMDIESLGKGVGALTLVMVLLSATLKSIGKASRGVTTYKNILSLVLSVGAVALLVMALSKIDFVTAVKGTVAFMAFVTLFRAAVTMISKPISEMKGKELAGVWKLVILIGTMSILVYILGKMNVAQAIKGLAALTILALDLKLLMWAVSGIKKENIANTTKAMTGILAFSVALAVLALSVSYLGTLSDDQWLKGIAGITIMIAAMSILIRSVAKMNTSNWKTTITAIGVMFMVVEAIKVFSNALKDAQAFDTKKTAVFVGGFVFFIGSVIALMAVVDKVKIGVKGFIAAVAMIGVALLALYGLTSILKNLQGISTESMEQFIKIVECLALIVGVMGAISAILGLLGPTGAFIGVLASIVLIIGVIAVIAGAIAFLAIGPVKKTLIKGMQALGEILGASFVGFAIQMEKAQKIIDRSHIDFKAFTTMAMLASSFGALAMTLPDNTTVGNLTGVSSFKTFSEGIPTFVQSCVDAYGALYSTNDKGKSIANMNVAQFAKDIKNLTDAAGAIADISVPRTNVVEGIVSDWGGQDYTGFGQFCKNLPTFVKACITAYQAMFTVNEDGKTVSTMTDIKKFKEDFLILASIANAFSEFESNLPEFSFIDAIGQKCTSLITGGTSDGFSKFCEELPMFVNASSSAYDALYGESSPFASKLQGKDISNFGTDMNTILGVGTAFASLEQDVPDLSFFQAFTGKLFDVDMTGFDQFCDDIPQLVNAFGNGYDALYKKSPMFAAKVKGKDFTTFAKDFNTVINLAQNFANVKSTIPGSTAFDALVTTWTGIDLTGFDGFCEDIPQLVNAFGKGYDGLYGKSSKFSTIKDKDVSTFANDFGTLVSVANDFAALQVAVPEPTAFQAIWSKWVPGTDFSGFDGFCQDIPQLVSAFGNAYNELYGENSEFKSFSGKNVKTFGEDMDSLFRTAGSFDELLDLMPDFDLLDAWSKSWGGKDSNNIERGDQFAQFCSDIGEFIKAMVVAYGSLYDDVETSYGPAPKIEPEGLPKVVEEVTRDFDKFEADIGIMISAANKLVEFMQSVGAIEDLAGNYHWWEKKDGEDSQLDSFFNYVDDFGTKLTDLQGKISGMSAGTMARDMTTAIGTVNSLKYMILDLAKLDEEGLSIADKSYGFNKMIEYIGTFGDTIDGFEYSYSEAVDIFKQAVDAYEKLATVSNRTVNTETISSDLSGLNEAASTAGKGVSESMETGMSEVDVSGAAASSMESLVRAFAPYYGKFQSIGRNLMKGLINGFTSGDLVTQLKQAAGHTIDDVVDVMRRHGLIKSPSRKTAEIGKYLGLGLVKGLNDYSGLVSKTAGGVSDDAIDAIRGAMTGVSNLIDSDISLDPVIRPVVDMSNVTSSSNAIDSMLSANRTVKLNTSRVASTFNRTAGIQNGSGSTSTSFANDSSVNITGNQFVIRNEQDIRSLAHEIASYTNQQQRNLGMATR